MMQLDLFDAPEVEIITESIKVGETVRLRSNVLQSHEAKGDWESYYYLLDAKGIGSVLSSHERKGGNYYIVAFGKVELYVTDDELEVV